MGGKVMLKSKPKILIAFLAAFIMAGNSGTYAKADTTDTINRIAGADRYDTADAIVEKGWTQSDMVVITSGVDFPDALCAGPLAKKYNAPIFLAAKDGLSDETIDKIKELNATKVIIVGGKGAVSANVEIQLSGIGITSVQRIGGTNRYNTSVLVAEQLNKPSAVVIALGDNYPDVLSISAIASQQGMPIILASKNSLSDEAVNYIKNSGVTKTYIVGGTSVLSSSIENSVPNPIRLSGSNRYETNLAVLNQFTPNLMFNNVYIATGNNFADALAGCELAAKSQSPIILVSNNLTSRMSNYIKRHISINTNVIALGGNNAVNDSIIEEILEMYHPVGLDKVPLAEDSSDKKGL
jgi:putative cell wall-binding protein